MTATPVTAIAHVQAGAPPESLEDQVKRVELQVKLATAQASLKSIQQTDLGLPTVPDVTARVPTISDKGGASAAALAAARALSREVPTIVAAIRAASASGGTIVVIDDPKVSASSVLAFDLKVRTALLAAELTRVGRDRSWGVSIDLPNEPPRGTSGSPSPGQRGSGAASPGPEPTGPVAGQVLRFAVDLLDAISPTTTLSGRDVALSVSTLRAKVAGQLAAGVGDNQRTVIAPDQAAILASDTYASAFDLAVSAEGVRTKVLKAQTALVPATTRLEILRAELDAADKLYVVAVGDPSKGDKVALAAETARLKNAIRDIQQSAPYRNLSSLAADASAVLVTVDAYLAYISARVDGVSPLQRATLAELISGSLPLDAHFKASLPKNRYLLHLDVAMAAGDIVTTSSFFDTRIEATGSAQIVYQLTNLAGHVLAADERHGSQSAEVVGGLPDEVRVTLTLLVAVMVLITVYAAISLFASAVD